MVNLFIFHNDLRLQDNTGLEAACRDGVTVPIFIFTPKQVTNNSYKSDRAVKFMCECLELLDSDLKSKGSKLFIFYGNTYSIIKKICEKIDVEGIYFNENYTPFAMSRDEQLKKLPNVFGFHDYSLWEMGSSRDGDVYKKYTPYFNKVNRKSVRKPSKYSCNNFVKSSFRIAGTISNMRRFYKNTNYEYFLPGRKEGVKTLNNISKNYGKIRDVLSKNTTMMSAHIKFGTISIREVYDRVLKNGDSDLKKQIIWREFYMNILWKFPYVVMGNNPQKRVAKNNKNFKPLYSKVGLKSGTGGLFKKWASGQTGFPIVDACMRELNETGYLHNRGRLIVANFLIKLMGWHWMEGEKYFATHLVDYDIANNNGGWQYVAGSGTDSQPYYRIMNPARQNEKFDADCEYVKTWVPELSDVDPKHIYDWADYRDEYNVKYPKPILDYISSKEKIYKKYKSLFK